MDAEKFQILQKAQYGVKQAREFLEVMETKAMKDLAKTFALKSGEKDNKDFAKDLASQEANLAKELAVIQDKKSKQKAEIKVLHGKLLEKCHSIIGDVDLAKLEDLKTEDTDLAKEMYKIKTLQGKPAKKLRRQEKQTKSRNQGLTR